MRAEGTGPEPRKSPERGVLEQRLGWGGGKREDRMIRKYLGKPNEERSRRRLAARVDVAYNVNVALTW